MKGAAGLSAWVREVGQLTYDLRDVAQREWNSPQRFRRPWLWRHGLLSERQNLYRLDQIDRSLYLSDFARLSASRLTSRHVRPVLGNKLVFHAVIARRFDRYLPRLHALVLQGRLQPPPMAGPGQPQPTSLVDFLDGPGVVLKPIAGGGGEGVHIVKRVDGALEHNGRPADVESVLRLQRALQSHLVSEYLQQHDYSHSVFSGSPNTLRLMALRNDGAPPFLAAAVHRFGTPGSIPVDNASRSGLSSRIDLTSGLMGPAVWTAVDGRRSSSAKHPATGRSIEGVTVPYWGEVKQLVLDLAAALPYLPYVGWDILVTERGPRIIEGNHFPGPGMLQVHQPLLADPRVRDFYRQRGIVDRPTVAGRLRARLAREKG